jgi:hypothetical protein
MVGAAVFVEEGLTTGLRLLFYFTSPALAETAIRSVCNISAALNASVPIPSNLMLAAALPKNWV